MENTVPVVGFDSARATRVFPRPVLKPAVHVPGVGITTIKASWGDQSFQGEFYLVTKDGVGRYGSAAQEWRDMHTEMSPGAWVKTAVPTAYQVTEACRIETVIKNPDGSGTLLETSYVLATGDWALRQPGGEVQHVKKAKYPKIYFTDAEAQEEGLTKMTDEEFAQFVIEHVSR